MPASWTKDGVQSAVTTDASQNTTITGDLTVSGTFAPTTLTVDTDTLHVDSVNNRVGVGTTSPDSTLHVDGNTRVTALTIGGTTSTAQITLYQSGTTDDGQDGVVLGPVRSGHTSSNSHSLFLQSAWSSGGDTINRWNVWSLRALQPGDNDSGATLDFINEANATANQPDADATNAESILSLSKSTATQLKLSYDATNYATFDVASDGLLTVTTVDPDGAEADIIFAPDGNVGIGVTDPAAKLEVFSTTEQVRLSYDGSSYASFTVDSSSNLKILTGESGAVDIDAGTIDLSTQTVDVTLNAAVDALNFDSNTLSIDATNNRVGIGTAAPSATLHVTNSSDSAHQLIIESTNTSAGGAPDIRFLRNPGEAGADNDYLGHINFAGYDDAGTPKLIDWGQMYCQIVDASNATKDSLMSFRTYAADSLTDMLTIKSDKVGINTLTPDATLEVVGSFAANGPSSTFITMSSGDTSPDVSGGNIFKTHTDGVTIDQFDGGVCGQIITIISGGATVYDVTSSELNGGTTNITTAAGDVTMWVCESATDWHLLSWMDLSIDLSSGGF